MNNMNERLVVGGVALLVGLLVGWAGHGLASYSMTTETVTANQDWRTACPAATMKDTNCEIVQDILDGKSHSEIARVAIAHDNGKPVMGFTMPLGVALDPGMGLVFGTDAEKAVPYRTCTSQGCVAEIPLDAKIQASLDAGKDGKMMVSSAADNRRIAIPLSLKGFADAQRVYRSNEAKRGSWFWRMWQ
jgi:invasion protein IalB